MPHQSNHELDELVSILESALRRRLPNELVAAARNALDIIRAARSTIGPECTPSDLVHYLEMPDDDDDPHERVLH